MVDLPGPRNGLQHGRVHFSVDLLCCDMEEALNYHSLKHGRVHFSVDLIYCHMEEALNYCPGITVRVDWG